jgi:hypothetical protein
MGHHRGCEKSCKVPLGSISKGNKSIAYLKSSQEEQAAVPSNRLNALVQDNKKSLHNNLISR